MTATPTIGFIGLGLLGGAMAERLVACGFSVIGFDIDADRMAALAECGVASGASPADLAQRCDIVLVCVTTSDAVTEVVSGAQGVIAAGRQNGKLLIDHSTTDIGRTMALARQLSDATGMTFIDAPVSGGPGAAADGTLAIMVGGPAAAVDAVRPIMEQLGRFTRMGDNGAGQATKLVNQTLVLTNYCVIAEALRLAQAFGVDASKIPDALATGHAGSNLLPILLERMIPEDFAPRGYARQVLKDLEMLHDATKNKHLAMPMASQALTMFRTLVAQGDGELDGSAVVSLLPRPR